MIYVYTYKFSVLCGGDGGSEIIIKLGKRVPREKLTPAPPLNIINSFNVPYW